MALDDRHDTLPEGGVGIAFTKDEWARSAVAVEKIKARLAKTCRHLIVNPDPPKKRKVDWAKVKRERERVEQDLRDAELVARGFDG